MNFETLDYVVAENVATITLNRPEAANAMNPLMAAELNEVAIACGEDETVRAIVIQGTGRIFCAGGDLAEFAKAGDSLPALIMKMAGDLHLAISRFTRMNAPVIAAVGGTAAGAGFSLAVAADLVVAGESSKFTMAYTAAGLSPDGSSTYFLPRRIGDRRARELMLTNRLLKAPEALEWGLINEVVGDDEVRSRANALAISLANGPTLAYGAVKTLLNESFDNGLETQMELETRSIARMAKTPDGQEGINAFLAKRKPGYTGKP